MERDTGPRAIGLRLITYESLMIQIMSRRGYAQSAGSPSDTPGGTEKLLQTTYVLGLAHHPAVDLT